MGKYNQSTGVKHTRIIFSLMLLCAVNTAFALSPENGWYWNPQEPGRGFNIELQNNTIFLATFVYTDAGAAIWYSGSGTLNADNTATLDLSEFANGQCIQCSFKTAQPIGAVETITIRFISNSSADLVWSGGTVAIERFNFSLGETTLDQLLGEWSLVSGDPALPVYTGDRIVFNSIMRNSVPGSSVVQGNRSGNTNAQISVFDAIPGNTSVRGFLLSGLLLTDSATLRAYAFSFAGLNRIEGVTADLPTNATANEINQALTNQGVPFIGFRIE